MQFYEEIYDFACFISTLRNLPAKIVHQYVFLRNKKPLKNIGLSDEWLNFAGGNCRRNDHNMQNALGYNKPGPIFDGTGFAKKCFVVDQGNSLITAHRF
ncbi:hypothetical protein COO92_05180 [Thalassospira lohafexi]|uniref:Uncharacterized protein n=1 Tax=Thalassospira lohafexi TaxID=744227 RepID=A0A2N3L9B5_9PROT|nr:hypothetical protein COO92_05180 [Thalassospira lohafexi]